MSSNQRVISVMPTDRKSPPKENTKISPLHVRSKLFFAEESEMRMLKRNDSQSVSPHRGDKPKRSWDALDIEQHMLKPEQHDEHGYEIGNRIIGF